jgi:hypothetical protein
MGNSNCWGKKNVYRHCGKKFISNNNGKRDNKQERRMSKKDENNSTRNSQKMAVRRRGKRYKEGYYAHLRIILNRLLVLLREYLAGERAQQLPAYFVQFYIIKEHRYDLPPLPPPTPVLTFTKPFAKLPTIINFFCKYHHVYIIIYTTCSQKENVLPASLRLHNMALRYLFS